MSECVVRMKKYGNCLDCDLHQIVYGDSYADTDVYCFKEKRYVGKRFGHLKDLTSPSWCPILCQLPEGHGRLADADKLMKDWQTWRSGMYEIAPIAMIDQVINDLRCAVIAPAEAERSE